MKLRQWADRQGIVLFDEIVDDGDSAMNLTRRGIQRILRLVHDGTVDGLAVTRLDRLTRRSKDLLALVERLEKRNLALVSITENLDTTTAAGRLVMTVLGEMASWEREVRRRGAKIGRARPAASDGRERKKRPKRATFKDAQRTVERIRALSERGVSLDRIAEQLHKGGHPPMQGTRWQARTVKDILERDRRRRRR